ncbi:MAG TPA: sulfotransferase [Candidatus Sulfotelmatobacter sp.]|jgi:hypothetical protein|nr:sulfotransferase [Candidatus Sulfotelmatobacter sp.]
MSGNGFAEVAEANGGSTTRALPSFFVIGPPRTGTSWLHAVLSQCTWLSHPTKETRFFDKHFDRGLEWYRSHYLRATEARVIGEVAPTYFASAQARERIASLIPHAKIICTFRNPVDRIVSLYRVKRAYGFLSWSFEEALVHDTELTESSRYAAHLKAWRDTFGESQVMATLHDDIQADPQSYFDKIVDFVGARRQKLLPSQLNRVFGSEEMTEPRHFYWTRGGLLMAEWAKKRRLDSFVAKAKKFGALKLFVGGGTAFADLSAAQRASLRERFRPEVEQLEAAINRDLSAWK